MMETIIEPILTMAAGLILIILLGIAISTEQPEELEKDDVIEILRTIRISCSRTEKEAIDKAIELIEGINDGTKHRADNSTDSRGIK